MKRRALNLTLEQADAHQRKHGFAPLTSWREKQLDRVHGSVDLDARVEKKTKLRDAPKMNKIEREQSMILEAQKRRNEITRWEFEGITLQWGGVRYTPDFDVFADDKLLKFVEVKGPYIHEGALMKFKLARAHWREFEFELHQNIKGTWTRLL